MPEKCIHESFQQTAAASPDALAVAYQDQRLTFGELNSRSNKLARHLRNFGVGPEVVVGVHMERSPEMIVALLAILKAGGVFAVSQPGYSSPRLPFLLTNGSASRPQLPATGVHVIDIGESSPEIALEDPGNLSLNVRGDNAAYIVYTSGSSGEPKGAIKLHRGIVARVPLAKFEAHEVCAQNMSFSFEYAVARLFVPLLSGVPVAVIGNDTVKDIDLFVSALEFHRVTNIALVPSLLRQLVNTGPQVWPRLSRVRSVTVGGAAFPSDLVESFAQAMPQAKLLNQFGGTEAGLISIAEVPRNTICGSIGRPVAATSAYLLDEDMRPVPTGTAGELYVGGPQLARGYMGDPALTAERFVPNPLGDATGERLYRTGDLARYLQNGEIELLGRVDRQIKVRGFRVEPEAVETILRQHRSIREVAVVARKIDKEVRLVAYVVNHAGAKLDVSDLRNYVQERLPEPMWPSVFVPLDRLPVTAHGKIDAGALPAPPPARPELSSPYEPPRDSTETAIAEVWAVQLGLHRVGVHDNFLDLGGDSLIAAKIVSRIQDLLGVKVPFRSILNGSVAELAARFPAAAKR